MRQIKEFYEIHVNVILNKIITHNKNLIHDS